ncbi:MAG: GTPase, partial [Gemmatimonadota bacterium]
MAIVGRPNVGKSTLFNRILGERVAIVAEQEGVTRDRHFAPADWAGHEFMLVDTGGVVDVADRPLEEEVRQQVMTAVEHADVLLFVVDAQAGVHPVVARIAE